MVSTQRWTVNVVREMDGHVICTRYAGLSAGEVMARRYEEECLPGEVTAFVKTKYLHGEAWRTPEKEEAAPG